MIVCLGSRQTMGRGSIRAGAVVVLSGQDLAEGRFQDSNHTPELPLSLSDPPAEDECGSPSPKSRQRQRDTCTAATADVRVQMRYVSVSTFNLCMVYTHTRARVRVTSKGTQLQTWPTDGNEGQRQEPERGGRAADAF